MLLVLVTLAVSVAVVAAAGAVAFADVAFHPPEYSAAAGTPFGAPRRRRTFEWFSATAERLTRGLIDARRDAGEAFHVGGVDCGAAERGDREGAREPIDSGFCATRTGVTGPETLEIAEFLRKTQPEDRVEAIRRNAAVNARLDVGLERLKCTKAAVRCPLACDDGTCVAMPVRPIQCRVHCALFGHEVSTAGNANDAQAAAAGAEDGLRHAMTAAGLTDELYELNSALATALSEPDAAGRWAGGENPFADCTAYSRP